MGNQESVQLSNGAQMPMMGFNTDKVKEVEAVEAAITEIGYRHMDTSTLFENEAQVGKAISNAIEKGKVKREELFITSKLEHRDYKDPEAALKSSL